jgi:hypothetical protein
MATVPRFKAINRFPVIVNNGQMNTPFKS